MSRGPQLFKERDVTKAVRAVEKAGKKVCRVEIAKGKIVVISTDGVHDQDQTHDTDWD